MRALTVSGINFAQNSWLRLFLQRLVRKERVSHNVQTLAERLGGAHREVFELLVAGVAFEQTTKRWEVFSHEGEYIGSLPTYRLLSLQTLLRRNYDIEIERLYKGADYSKGVTYGWHPYMTYTEQARLMNELADHPRELV